VGTYVYDTEWREERERLAGMEALWDPGTIALMEGLGVDAGWRCVEVGAGGGSVTEWLADRVGGSGHVLATDLTTRYLDAIERPNVEVREHDVISEPLPEGEFDLAHARLLVEHVGTQALAAMVDSLRPGGTLLVEDYDFCSAVSHPQSAAVERAKDAVLGFMAQAGFDPDCGRKLPAELAGLGLEEIGSEGRVRVYDGGSPGLAFYRLSLTSLHDQLIEAGAITGEQIDAALEAVDDPSITFLSPVMVACWGTKA
jgi:SAM-dependent methyltransferase